MHSLLFIEDDDQIRLALRLALEDEGYAVVEAADGRTGLAAFDKDEPDLVLVDLRLPDIQGFDVVRTIRARSIVPIIIVTAQTDTYDTSARCGCGASVGGPARRPSGSGRWPGGGRARRPRPGRRPSG
jgi:DNA-binding response OmpR family regulator